MPSVISGCTLLPIPKPGKDPSCSDHYHAIALASTTSKIIEWIILLQYSQYVSTSDLQFGFKPGISTSMCTGSIICPVTSVMIQGCLVAFWMQVRHLT